MTCMFNLIDSQEEIVLAQMAKLLTKYAKRIITHNGDGESLLRCAGLSSLVEKYNNLLTPYTYNGTWENPYPQFNPGLAINKICDEIKDNKIALGNFLNEFLSRVKLIDICDIEKIKNYLEVIGYRLEIIEIEDNYSYEPSYSYSLYPYTEGVLDRSNDCSYLVDMLNKNHGELVTYYREAISTYGNIEYQGCVSNCRTLLEGIFKKADSENGDYATGILNVTKESVNSSNSPRLSIRGIFDYWNINRKGFNRYRLFVTMYSLMSALAHGEEVPTKEDALMCLRITEDILIWYFQNINL